MQRKQQESRRKGRQKESAGKQSSPGDLADNTWAGGREQSSGFRSEVLRVSPQRGRSGEAGTRRGCRAPLRPRRALGRRLPSPGLPARTSGGCARGARGRAGDLARVPEGRTRQSAAPSLGWRWSLGKKSQWRSRRGQRGEQGPGLGAHGRPCGAPQTLEEPESVGGKGCLISFSLPTPPPPLLRPCPPSPPPPSPSLRLMWALGRRET